MSTYYQRLRHSRREQISDTPSDLETPELSVLPQHSILIFPSPPSDPSTPSLTHLRHGSATPSIPASLISSVEARSPPTGSTPTDSWDDLGSDAQRLRASEPLTRDRLAQLQSGFEWSENGLVEHWEWSGGMSSSSSSPSSLLQGRRPLSRPPPSALATDYHSASSEFHFSTTSSSRLDDESDFGSLFMVALRTRDDPNLLPDPFASTNSCIIRHPKTFRLPFESWLRYIFDLDPTTLDLLKQSSRPHLNNLYHGDHPEQDPSCILFTAPTIGEKATDADQDVQPPRDVFSDGPHIAIRTLRKGLEGLSDQSISAQQLFSTAIRVPYIILQAVLR
ncbi:uncharacterized protein EI90DRAFT_3121998 [Cantharellus anzutake]|uniref:uncharacterized protein n=1 Tax=Cantharellus anzutake TaxID=1750568 RepID=UPI0019053EA3|nr:uncharacterized protein EI90DRAFT_3121998 [Cantharellus anzutake]KAF8333648.1 hypothetical protein EI90DRAFT_3121998 [Cantharellus anzutake]